MILLNFDYLDQIQILLKVIIPDERVWTLTVPLTEAHDHEGATNLVD